MRAVDRLNLETAADHMEDSGHNRTAVILEGGWTCSGCNPTHEDDLDKALAERKTVIELDRRAW